MAEVTPPLTPEARVRALAAFTAGFQWALNGTDKYGEYNGGTAEQGFEAWLADAPAERVEPQGRCPDCSFHPVSQNDFCEKYR